jgi:hypothetical protein
MQFQLPIEIKLLSPPVMYKDKIMLIGSCFTEHIGNALGDLKFNVLQNPNGILFSPDAVCKSLLSYIGNKKYTDADLFYLNEVWNSWDHHSRFSEMDKEKCLENINVSQTKAHHFLKEAEWLIITLGSSFIYELTRLAETPKHQVFANRQSSVANCHRAPANWFEKKMLDIDEIKKMLAGCLEQLQKFNPRLKFIFTVSPVRHIRDGVVENNRSKARLIEAVHFICTKFSTASYFPAYELVIDVLRDYRFYDIDLVHPNYPATEFVLEKFSAACMNEETMAIMEGIKKIVIAKRHKAFQPATNAHRQFLQNHFKKTKELAQKYPFLNLADELEYFSNDGIVIE